MIFKTDKPIKNILWLLLAGAAIIIVVSVGLHLYKLKTRVPQRTDFNGRGGQYTRTAFDSGARGWVPFNVYLPPGWSSEDDVTYPLLIFIHGQHDDEIGFTYYLPADRLNEWINAEEIPPMVIVAPRGDDNRSEVQWYTWENESLLTNETGELRTFCREHFKAGMTPETVSLQGHSRGASGALHFAFHYPHRFASVMANAFVSDYVLKNRIAAATENRDKILKSGVFIRMVIGSEDEYGFQYNRQGTYLLHDHLESLGIPHEFEVLPQVAHSCRAIFFHRRADGMRNILYELKRHAEAWAKAMSN